MERVKFGNSCIGILLREIMYFLIQIKYVHQISSYQR